MQDSKGDYHYFFFYHAQQTMLGDPGIHKDLVLDDKQGKE